MKKTLTVALVQQSCGATREANLEASVRGIREAASKGAELVLLPELHLGPYFCQVEDTASFDLAEPIPGPTCARLGEIGKELGIVVVGSLFERRAPGLYHNTAVVLEKDGSLAGKYRKMHIPDDPGYYEKFYFTPGDMGFKPIETSVGRLGILVCWDQWYPEAARLMALAGADLLLYPTAIGWNPDDVVEEQQRQLNAWITIQRGHAVANGLPVLSCNRIGHEPDPSGNSRGIQFWGNSFVAGPQGEFLDHADDKESRVLTVEIDRTRSEDVRRIWPFLRDRRIDEYSGLVKRFLD
jgi:N-carbamoylputrescine amidase